MKREGRWHEAHPVPNWKTMTLEMQLTPTQDLSQLGRDQEITVGEMSGEGDFAYIERGGIHSHLAVIGQAPCLMDERSSWSWLSHTPLWSILGLARFDGKLWVCCYDSAIKAIVFATSLGKPIRRFSTPFIFDMERFTKEGSDAVRVLLINRKNRLWAEYQFVFRNSDFELRKQCFGEPLEPEGRRLNDVRPQRRTFGYI
jgi:hypothetical protein